MNYRIFSLSALVFLAACNDGHESTSESTFALSPKPFAYKDLAPPERSVQNENDYDRMAEGALDLASVSEAPSVKHNKLTINGKEINYTASAGHLIAKLPDGKPKADQAAVFYMAYTRDDLPRENRPVTFFWNGGPGSSSIFLHMGSWGPKRVKTNMPIMTEEAKKKKPDNFPLIDSEDTLLDQSDLVFVDPVGTGLSQAIKPYKNKDFWGMDSDARLLRDFITRYVNVNNRQSSPKYLYGESYGGIRTPIVANLLAQAGTSNFAADPSGKKPIVLSGIILNSPLLDYNTTCSQGNVSCAGTLPSFAMTADYYKQGAIRGTANVAQFLDKLRKFSSENYNLARKAKYPTPQLKGLEIAKGFQQSMADFFKENPLEAKELLADKDELVKIAEGWASFLLDDLSLSERFIKEFVVDPVAATDWIVKEIEHPTVPWNNFIQSAAGGQFLKDMAHFTGIAANWAEEFEMPWHVTKKRLMPDLDLNAYDARLNIPKDAYDIKFYEDESFEKGINTVLKDIFDFRSRTAYAPNGFDVITYAWDYNRDASLAYAKSSIPDLVETLGYYPSLKILALHGYYDLVTPFYQTEIDLKNIGLHTRIPVKSYEGGHMTYESEEARAPLKRDLDKFYSASDASGVAM